MAYSGLTRSKGSPEISVPSVWRNYEKTKPEFGVAGAFGSYRFAGVLADEIGERKCLENSSFYHALSLTARALSAPFFADASKEKKEKRVVVLGVYFRLLRRTATATMATMMMTAAMAM